MARRRWSPGVAEASGAGLRKHWPRPERISSASAPHWKQTPRSAKNIAARGKSFKGYACDFGDREAVRAFVEQVNAEAGPIDILINNGRHHSARSG